MKVPLHLNTWMWAGLALAVGICAFMSVPIVLLIHAIWEAHT